MRVPCHEASGAQELHPEPTWSTASAPFVTSSSRYYVPYPTFSSSQTRPSVDASLSADVPRPSWIYRNHTQNPVEIVWVNQQNHTAEAILGTLLGVALLYIVISSFIRPRFFARKATACCGHCRLAPDVEEAQVVGNSNGKGTVLFEAASDDDTAPLLGEEKD